MTTNEKSERDETTMINNNGDPSGLFGLRTGTVGINVTIPGGFLLSESAECDQETVLVALARLADRVLNRLKAARFS